MNQCLINIREENGQLVVSSREVAERFGKRHADVIRAIQEKIEINAKLRSSNYYIENTYIDSMNRPKKEYLMTRDGFTFIVMGFTGAEADMWKLKYIEAFNKMEQALKEQQTLPQDLSPQLQFLINMELEQKKMKQQLDNQSIQIAETKEELKGIRDIVSLNPNSWRKDSTNLVNQIAMFKGGTQECYREIRYEIYALVNQRAGCNLEIRLTNMKRRLREEGICNSKLAKLNQLDVIAQDKKLIEIYLIIVKEMCIKYGLDLFTVEGGK